MRKEEENTIIKMARRMSKNSEIKEKRVRREGRVRGTSVMHR